MSVTRWVGGKGAPSRWLALAAALPLLLAFAGCDWNNDHEGRPIDREAPAAPRDLYSITGDTQVTLVWLANTESDLRSYNLWWSDQYTGSPYHLIAKVPACSDCYWMDFTDTGLTNGQTIFYAVTAVDDAGNESELSHEEVWDTPRPQGHAAVANADLPGGHGLAAFDLHNQTIVPADSPDADFYYVHQDATGGYLVAGSELYAGAETTEIQDMGWTGGFDEISFAPDDQGWSPTGTAEPITGHVYVLLTRDGHYAKIRLTEVAPDHVAFDWAYQLSQWNRQLGMPEGK